MSQRGCDSTELSHLPCLAVDNSGPRFHTLPVRYGHGVSTSRHSHVLTLNRQAPPASLSTWGEKLGVLLRFFPERFVWKRHYISNQLALVQKLLKDAAEETETLVSEQQSHVQGRCLQSGL